MTDNIKNMQCINNLPFAYVCFTKDDNYIDLLNILIRSIKLYSSYPLFIYVIDFPFDNLKNIDQPDGITIIPYAKDNRCQHMYNYKAFILSDFISKNYATTACYLDVDTVITPNCDNIFKKAGLITDCPISPFHINNINDYTIQCLMKLFNVPSKTCRFLHNDLILFNKNTEKFMNEWSSKGLEANYITLWDEYVMNVLLWKYNISDTHYIERIDYIYDCYYNNESSRNITYLYHGCKNKEIVNKLFIDMVKYYPHPLTIYKSPFPKIRIGRDNDGGYIIADIQTSSISYDIFLSAGIANDISFEIDFMKKYNNSFRCVAFDGSIDKLPQESNNIEFFKLNISNKNTDNTTNLERYFDNYNNIFLKMDIEGGEEIFFTTITTEKLLKIKQLVIEIHKSESHIPTQLAKTHYLIHVHANNYGGVGLINDIPIPSVYELTYVRKDCFNEKPELNIDLVPVFGLDQQNGLYRPDGSYRPEILLHCKPYVNKHLERPWVQTSYNSFPVEQ